MHTSTFTLQRRINMEKLTVSMWITLDGFVASSDGEIGWLLESDEM